MNILVAVKPVPDPANPPRLRRDGGGLDDGSVRWVINPLDEVALAAAQSLRTAGRVVEVTAITVAPAHGQGCLRTALALGADRALWVPTEGLPDPWLTSGVLQAVLERWPADLVLTGRQGIDEDHHQTGPLLAGRLGWAAADGVVNLVLDEGVVRVVCEEESGQVELELKMPAVLAVESRLADPGYASLPMIMAARQKPIQVLSLVELGVTAELRLPVRGWRYPALRPPGQTVPSAAALAQLLRQRGWVG